MALGIALTNNPVVYFTTERIRLALRLMRPNEPDYATKSLLTQLTLASIDRICRIGASAAGGSLAPGRLSRMGLGRLGHLVRHDERCCGRFGANAQAARRAL